jgi:hypothetical protein
MTNPETGMNYSRAELKAAFELVENKENWKLPIDAVVPYESKLDQIREAVIFFAGCTPRFTLSPSKGFVRVRAAGYYMAVGA